MRTTSDPLAVSNVIYDETSPDSSGSMPLGNGDIGLNVWVESDGDLLFYVSKTDAWDEHGRLLKLGRVRVKLSPNPFRAGLPFRQELKLRQGEIQIHAGEKFAEVVIRVWVDANRPVIRVQATGKQPFDCEAALEVWRTQKRPLTEDESASVDSFTKDEPKWVYPDTVVKAQKGDVKWFHRNVKSIWSATLRHQELESLIPQFKDPLLHRTFGAAMRSDELVRTSDTTIKTPQPVRRMMLSIHPLTAQTHTIKEWLSQLESSRAETDSVSLKQARAQHLRWWNNFWKRSWIRIGNAPNSEHKIVSQGYTLQRFINACGGRGDYPVKFNGSIFTVDVPGKFDADFREWGGGYWFQNTRLPYWPMLASGDLDLMQPLFQMYLNALPLAQKRTEIYYSHSGAFFPETMYFWGTYQNGSMGYGWDRAGEPKGQTVNRYIRYYWQGGIELTAMMLDYYSYTGDRKFLRNTLLPLASSIIEFYDKHYPRDSNGQVRFVPAMALETWWDCENPLPEIAGLRSVLSRLLELPDTSVSRAQREAWRRLLSVLPPIPLREADGGPLLAPAADFKTKQNVENPELYAVFPYRLYGVGKPDLELARRTFASREFKGNNGWAQDDTQAALLGLAEEARRMLVSRFSTKHAGSRFPAFWGPNYDWIPDQDHGGNGLMTLQSMLLQCEGRKLSLFPAWPKDWDVEFKLHAPRNTTLEGVYSGGKLTQLKVTPAERQKDVVILQPQ